MGSSAFALWYNESHLHSALIFVTPGQRHRGEDTAILAKRHALYKACQSPASRALVRPDPQLGTRGHCLSQPGKTREKGGATPTKAS